MSAVRLEDKPELAARTRLQVDSVTGEPVLLYPEGVLQLNDTASDIVQKCDGSMTVAAIIEKLASEYDAPPDELGLDVLDCLTLLTQKGLVVLRQ